LTITTAAISRGDRTESFRKKSGSMRGFKQTETLLNAVNKAMDKIKVNGTLQDIIDEHINTK